jgi:sugar lactone lactonase YvrE
MRHAHGSIGAFAALACLAAPSAWAQRVSPATQDFQNPIALAYYDGRLLVANSLSDSVSKVTFAGHWITREPAKLHSPQGLAVDQSGNLYVANGAGGTIDRITPAGVQTVFATGFTRPQALAVSDNGTLYVADQMKGTISTVSQTGTVAIFAHGLAMPSALAFDGFGNLFVANAYNGTISKITTAGKVTTFATGLAQPYGLAFAGSDTLYVSEIAAGRISQITSKGKVSVFAQNSALGAAPQGLVSVGNTLYAGLTNNTVVSITKAGKVAPLAPLINAATAVAQDPAGDVFILSGGHSLLEIPAGATRVVVLATNFTAPISVAADSAGNAYVGDQSTGTVTKVTPSGTETVFAAGLGAVLGLAYDPNGTLFAATSPNLANPGGTIVQISAAGVTTPYASFSANTPTCLAVDPSGNLYADIGPFDSTQVVQVEAGGATTALATVNGSCEGMAFDASGTLYVSYLDIQVELEFYPGIASVSAAGSVAYLNADAGGQGIVATTAGGITRLIVPNVAGNGLNYVTPSLAPLPPPHYAYTQADARDVATYGSLPASVDFAELPPPGGGQLVKTCAGPISKLAPSYSVCANVPYQLFGQAITAVPQYFTDRLGLDFAGALPPSKTPLSADGLLARFAVRAQGLSVGLVYNK